MFYVLFLFVFFVLFVSIFKNSFVVFCFCVVVFVTRLRGHFVCILWSFFLFLLFCFEFVFFVVSSFLSKKDPPKKPDTAKTQKNKNAEKNGQKNQLAQLCSQIVFFNFLGGFEKFIFWHKTLKKWWFWHVFKREKRSKMNKIVELKICPIMLRNIMVFPSFFISFSLQKEKFLKNKTI